MWLPALVPELSSIGISSMRSSFWSAPLRRVSPGIVCTSKSIQKRRGLEAPQEYLASTKVGWQPNFSVTSS